MSKELIKKLAEIQQKLKAPKNQFNKFGGFHYRNQEDILEAVKPLLGDLVLTISDSIHVAADGNPHSLNRVYVKATATISDGEHSISNTAFAREEESKKGMDSAQLTGSTSSYARKYALNGLFLIDDTKDADTEESSGKKAPEKPVKQQASSGNSFRRKKNSEASESLAGVESGGNDDDI